MGVLGVEVKVVVVLEVVVLLVVECMWDVLVQMIFIDMTNKSPFYCNYKLHFTYFSIAIQKSVVL